MTDQRPTDAPDDIGYADAMAELEQLLAELDADAVDIDLLGARVKRAAELITICRARIEHARVDVEAIVVGLSAADEESDGVAETSDDDGGS